MPDSKYQMQPRVKRLGSEVLTRVSMRASEKGFYNEITERHLNAIANTRHEMITIDSRGKMVTTLVRLHTTDGEVVPLRIELDFEIYDSIKDESDA